MGLQQTLKALADPIRREILNQLKAGRLSAGEIADHFPVTAAIRFLMRKSTKNSPKRRSGKTGCGLVWSSRTSTCSPSIRLCRT